MIMPVPGPLRRWWHGPADPVLRTVQVLVLVLWPTVCVWVVPGLHRPGDGLVLAWALVVVYSTSALLLLLAPPARAQRLLPLCLSLFAVAAVLGAMAGPRREMALLVPLFLGVLAAVAAMRLDRRQTWGLVAVTAVAGLACVAWAAVDLVTFLVTAVAVVAAMATPAAAVLRLRTQLDAAHARERRLARTDPLTGVLNRRGLFEAAVALMAGSAQVDVVTLDLDDFKQLNDEHGHAAGDEALRAVGAALLELHERAGVPEPTLVARFGGEEFVVLAPVLDRTLAEVAEAVRVAAAASGPAWRTRGSVGAVRGTPPAETEERQAWLMRTVDEADELMYRAKRSGGDQVLAEVL